MSNTNYQSLVATVTTKPSIMKNLLFLVGCLFLICACTTIKGFEELAKQERYLEWQRKWSRKMPLKIEKENIHKAQTFRILNHLMAERRKAIETLHFNKAEHVARWLPEITTHARVYITEYPQSAALREAVTDAPCLYNLVASRRALSGGQYEEALALCRNCPPGSTTEEIRQNQQYIHREVCRAMAEAIHVPEGSGDYYSQAAAIKAFYELARRQGIDFRAVPYPTTTFQDYQGFLDYTRSAVVERLSQLSHTFLSTQQFENAKAAAESGLTIAIGPEKAPLDELIYDILKKGTAYYFKCKDQAAAQDKFDLAEDWLMKAARLNPNVQVNVERAKLKGKRAEICRKDKNYPCALEYLEQATTLDPDNPELLRKQKECRQEYGEQLFVTGNVLHRDALRNPLLFPQAIDELNQSLQMFPEAADKSRVKHRLVQVKDDYGHLFLQQARNKLDERQYDEARALCDQATIYLKPSGKVAADLKITINDTEGTEILDHVVDKIDKGQCKDAVEEARRAKPLLRYKNRANALEEAAMDCARRRVVVVLENKTDLNLSDYERNAYLSTIRRTLESNWNEYFFVDNRILVSPGDPIRQARAAGADYAVVITLANLQSSTYSDPGTKSTVCTSISWWDANYGIWVNTYTRTLITDYQDKKTVQLAVQAKILKMKEGSVHDEPSKTLYKSLENTVTRSDQNIDPKYLRYCPSCCESATRERTYFLPQEPFARKRDFPSASSMIKPQIEGALTEIASRIGRDRMEKLYE